jgi:hypothetical protein
MADLIVTIVDDNTSFATNLSTLVLERQSIGVNLLTLRTAEERIAWVMERDDEIDGIDGMLLNLNIRIENSLRCQTSGLTMLQELLLLSVYCERSMS